jgi:predicted metal-binding membrane protein
VNSQSAAGFLPAGERAVIVCALAGITVLSWIYLVMLAGDMASVPVMAMSAMSKPWTPAHAGLMFAMWWVMMAGMMMPSATPMILTFATINRRRREHGQAYVPTAAFAAGYLVAWGGFSSIATALQWGMAKAALLSPMMTASSPLLGAGLCLAAGIYQFTPLKSACLEHCRSPFDFILNQWRDGARGALSMGVRHGLYCVGCCWVLMALLFVGGVMNLLWIAILAAFVFVEKLLPAGAWVGRIGGAIMIAFGVWLLAGTFSA